MLRVTSNSWFVAAKCPSSEPWLAWKTMVRVSLLDFKGPAAAAAAAAVGFAAACVGAVVAAGAVPPAAPHAARKTVSMDKLANRTQIELAIDLICVTPLWMCRPLTKLRLPLRPQARASPRALAVWAAPPAR